MGYRGYYKSLKKKKKMKKENRSYKGLPKAKDMKIYWEKTKISHQKDFVTN